MITLQFPNLHKALVKSKDLQDNDPRKGIIVISQNAIVFTDAFCLVVNLYDYFNIDCNITDDEDLEELEKILFFMDGKMFVEDYWKELTKGANMKVENGALSIENPKYEKDLHHRDFDVNLYQPLDTLTKVNSREDGLVTNISVPFVALKKIFDVLPDFKTDDIVFTFATMNEPVKFTFKNRKHFFGYIQTNYGAASEAFKYEMFENFINDPTVKILHKESKPAMAVPLPPTKEVQFTENEPDLFGADIRSHDE